MAEQFDFDGAIAAHREWVRSLSAHVSGGDAGMGLDAASDFDACPLGRWISNAAGDLDKVPAFSKLEVLHRIFHTTAGDVVSLTQAGREAMAEWLVKEQLCAMSEEIVAYLEQLKRMSNPGGR